MKLLILTQKIDKNDPILGFFHTWVLELSKKFEKVIIICLEKGEYYLPQNVKVFSLGKESGRSKIKYLKNFYNLILGLYREYDCVFVHMNQEYVVLGGFLWKVMRKKIFLWRNHPSGNLLTYLAVFLSNKVFCTSPYSFTKRFKKTELMPVGIDTKVFNTENLDQKPNSILSLGRISPIKNIEKMVDLAISLDNLGENFVFNIVGNPVNEEDYGYKEMLVKKGEALIKKGVLNFIPAVSQNEAAILYKKHSIFINLTPSGSLDKTILEAAACGCLVLVAGKNFSDRINKLISLEDLSDGVLVNKIINLFKMKEEEKIGFKKELQKYVLENHSLDALMNKLDQNIKS